MVGEELLALRVDAADDPVPDSRIEAALKWVIDNQSFYNIVAVNISFGSGHFSGNHTSSYSDELATLKSHGVFVAAASGNGGVSAGTRSASAGMPRTVSAAVTRSRSTMSIIVV